MMKLLLGAALLQVPRLFTPALVVEVELVAVFPCQNTISLVRR